MVHQTKKQNIIHLIPKITEENKNAGPFKNKQNLFLAESPICKKGCNYRLVVTVFEIRWHH
jgi:hypothetical protein